MGRSPWTAADAFVGLFSPGRQSRTRGSGADVGVRPTCSALRLYCCDAEYIEADAVASPVCDPRAGTASAIHRGNSRFYPRKIYEVRVPHCHARRRQAVHLGLHSEGRVHRRRKYPILLQRTGYNVAPYGLDQYRANLGPSDLFAREKFIFVYQDIRGRFMSEGKYVLIRPRNTAAKTSPAPGSKEIDETTDTWDTIDWLVKNVPGNTGKVGMYGISQPGFYATAGMIDAHPALVAVAPQAPVTDYYLGDDVYHNGAFMLAHRFSFYMGFRDREGDPAPPPPALPFQYGTPDGYDFYLQMGSIANADEKYFKHQQPLWNLNIDHPNLRRGLAIALHLEISEGHQTRCDAGGRLVRHRRSAGTVPPALLHGEEQSAEGRHAGDGAVESRRFLPAAMATVWAKSISVRRPRSITARTSNFRFSSTS